MRRQFRIGSTSYVYPADILPNVRQLAGLVEDVELVLFEVDDYGSNLPDAKVIDELMAVGEENNLSYTVHLPLDLRFGDPKSLDKAQRAIEHTRRLEPYAYVMHLEGRALLADGSAETLARWQHDAARAVSQIIDLVGDPVRMCIENVEGWDPELFREVVEDSGVSRCIDVGHLWLQERDPLAHLEKYLSRTRVIHLHGIGSRDHQSLSLIPSEKLEAVLQVLLRAQYAGVLTLEVFGVEDFFSSYRTLTNALEWLEAECKDIT